MRPPRPRARAVVRWGGRIAALVAMGVATSVAVAWLACSMLSQGSFPSQYVFFPHNGAGRAARIEHSFGVEFLTSAGWMRPPDELEAVMSLTGEPVHWRFDPWWPTDLPERTLQVGESDSVIGAGFPWICLWARKQVVGEGPLIGNASKPPPPLPPRKTSISHGAYVGMGPSGRGIVVPFHPVWRGLLLNTLFYGAVWLALGATFVAVRSVRRRRRNLCPSCAFSLAGAAHPGCPECGWGRA